jgi:urea transport system substrate-binding protein
MACSSSEPSTPTPAASTAPSTPAGDTVKVGVLHSLTGTMAISEIPVRDATLLAIEEINAAGGVMGKKIAVTQEDGGSEPATFAQKAQKLIQQDKVSTVFGGWTSASRKAMLPVFESNKHLLWYPIQFEGNECSPNIMYSGAQPNQQILPALTWGMQEMKWKNIYLIGSDYVFPRTANLILRKHIEGNGGTVAGEDYVPLGGQDFASVINKIKAAKPQAVYNTINGDSNVAFFKQLAAAGVTVKDLPIVSFSIAEQEAKAMGAGLMAGSYAAWNYFESVSSPENKKFVDAFKAKYGAGQVLDDPMVHGYIDVYLWKAAVEKAGTFDPIAVAKAARRIEVMTPMGKVTIDKNNSLYQTVYVGELQSNGQFKILWDSKAPVKPEPYDPKVFPGKTCSWE